jgi:hypothetical protein
MKGGSAMLSRANRVRVRGPVALFLFVMAAMAAACGGSAGVGSGPGAGPGGGGGPAGLPAASAGAAAATAAGGGEANAGGNSSGAGGGNNQGGNNEGGGDPGVVDQAGLLMVKAGALAIQVAALDTALDAAAREIAALGGYASASQRFGDGDDAQATVTYRIPVARWDEALGQLRGLGQKVIDERFSTEEVTAQVVDLEARIANLRTTEAAFQAIMARAEKIDDILTVQAQLTQVRGDIERLTAQKTNLQGQAAFSTLTVTFALKKDPILAEQQGFSAENEIEQASASLVSVLQSVATAGIWFGIVWLPILLALAVIGVSGLLIGRRLTRSSGGGDSPMPSADAGA